MGEWERHGRMSLRINTYQNSSNIQKLAQETCAKEDVQSQTCTLVINQLHINFLHCYSIQSPDFTHLLSSLGR